MKTFLLILSAAVLSYAKTPYWVQVIAVKHPSSLTKQFLAKTKKCYAKYRIVHQNGFKKVWLGSFNSRKNAYNAKKFFQTCLSKNAFIVKGYAKNNSKTAGHAKVKTVVLATKPVKTVAAKAINITAGTVSLQINTKALTQNQTAHKQNPAIKKCTVQCQKQQLRQSEIAAAIEFYKHSKYYRFSSK